MEGLFDGTATQRLLSFLADRPTQSFFVRELARIGGISLGAAHGAVHALAAAGLLKIERKGRRSFYTVDVAHPIVRQWKVLRTLVSLEPLLAGLREEAQQIILYGSRAAGVDREGSDIDLYVRTAHPEQAVRLVEESGLANRIQLVARTALGEVELERADPVFFGNVRRGLVLYDAARES